MRCKIQYVEHNKQSMSFAREDFYCGYKFM